MRVMNHPKHGKVVASNILVSVRKGLPAAQVKALRKLPEVIAVEPNRVAGLLDAPL